MTAPFRAFVVDQTADGFTMGIQRLEQRDLPPGDVLIQVAYAVVNDKDALVCIPNGNVARTYPLVLLAVKGWQVPQAIETMRPLVGPETFVVPLLNGVEATEQLAAAFGARRVLGGLCGLYGSVVGPGHIRNVLPRPFVTIGELDHAPSERCDHLRMVFEHADVQASIAADIHAALWEKLLFVGPFGGVGAVTRVPVGVLRRQMETRSLLEGTMREVFVLARAHGVRVADEAVEKALALIDLSPEQATASMQRDIMAGRPSELESQLGVVVRLAHLAGVEVPLHTFLYACLLPQERKAHEEIELPT